MTQEARIQKQKAGSKKQEKRHKKKKTVYIKSEYTNLCTIVRIASLFVRTTGY